MIANTKAERLVRRQRMVDAHHDGMSYVAIGRLFDPVISGGRVRNILPEENAKVLRSESHRKVIAIVRAHMAAN